jgi:hypothetical protein
MKKLFLFVIGVILSGCIINFQSEVPKKGIVDVKVRYVYPEKNELNTFDGYYKKQLEPGHYAQTKIELDPGQQLLILNKALVYRFYQMPDTFYHKGETTSAADQSLRIRADTLDKTIYWHGSATDLQLKHHRLPELIDYIDSIVESTDEYQGLPKSKS